jgi:hypothetical protein
VPEFNLYGLNTFYRVLGTEYLRVILLQGKVFLQTGLKIVFCHSLTPKRSRSYGTAVLNSSLVMLSPPSGYPHISATAMFPIPAGICPVVMWSGPIARHTDIISALPTPLRPYPYSTPEGRRTRRTDGNINGEIHANPDMLSICQCVQPQYQRQNNYYPFHSVINLSI